MKMIQKNNSFHNATPKGGKKTKSDIWITPKWIIDKIGPFDLDPCGFLPENGPIVKTAENYFTVDMDGLSQNWYGKVFVNFPYSESFKWLEKSKNEYLSGNVEYIIILCFARTETKAWQNNVKYATGINFINKRIKFLDEYGIEHSNGNCPSSLIAFGEKGFDKIKNIDGILVKIC